MCSPAATLLLRKQLCGFSAGLVDDDNIFKWQVLIMGPPDTLYEGGYFRAELDFPQDYPNHPPKMKFVTDIWHPNIARDETIITSVISMLAEPNPDSPANVDAAKEFREDFAEFKRKVCRCVRMSQEHFE
ncbi:unnamed protein product [Trichobilharzia regenti]|nr:unnamed protein product [Trichobilharzia regenti]